MGIIWMLKTQLFSKMPFALDLKGQLKIIYATIHDLSGSICSKGNYLQAIARKT